MSRRRKRSRSGGEADERVSAVLTVAAAGVGALRTLSVRGGDVDARDEVGGTLQTALHVASASGDIVVAEALLEAGAAVDAAPACIFWLTKRGVVQPKSSQPFPGTHTPQP